MSRNIIRALKNKDNPYVQINKTVLNDPNLSMKAKGLHCYMLSMPDDWEFHREELVTHFTDGMSALKSALKELKEAGYIKIEPVFVNGKIAYWQTLVFETPTLAKAYGHKDSGQQVENQRTKENLEVDFLLVENLPVENQPTTNNDNNKNDYLMKNDKHICQVRDVFEHWQKVMNHPRAVLDAKRKRLIEGALKQYSVSELKQAIDGCASSAWHMGKNDRGMIYDSIPLIFRDSDKIEDFIRMSSVKIKPTQSKAEHHKAINNAFMSVLNDLSSGEGLLDVAI